ncbi:SPOR domain-containing protein [Marinomonas sp. IMCC 4694]|uniref:SPOR domain-containing protein n=1 Tax=Marinomonas sp. IMCC 4694 TaxID=2605432 RepID=UPI0011E68E6D|nr:SPOR domain-containing protein [Marinomonas sp. IMCC 4694]TYL49141.1 SPOR domain-containing protein [Marinomonas sp. IMCC 4694]
MKWLFLFVVLLNAAFFGWQRVAQEAVTKKQDSVYGPPTSEKIRLLSEVSALKPEIEASVSVASQVEQALSKGLSDDLRSSAVFCPRLETEHQEDKKQIIQALNDLGWPYKEKESTGKRAKFWLYIAAPETPALADRIVKELAAKSIDSFVINRAEMKNRISLGLYSSKVRAEQSKISIQNASGYVVDVYEHMRTVSLQQVEIDQPIDESEWEDFMSRFDLSKMMIKLEKNPC